MAEATNISAEAPNVPMVSLYVGKFECVDLKW
jgi:hypothetical protein